MAKRKSFFDDEEEEKPVVANRPNAPVRANSEQIDQKIHDAKVLLEQTHQLYQHYFTGIERRPPIEKRQNLEARIAEIERIGGGTTAARFKISQFVNHWHQFREMWDRKLREKEKI